MMRAGVKRTGFGTIPNMPGSIPGPLGFAAFSGVKLAGYTLAGAVLRKIYPAAKARALIIGATRMVVGLAIGLSHLALWAAYLSRSSRSDSEALVPFLICSLVLRLLVWTSIVWFFCDREWARPGRIVAYAAAGTALSFLLDFAGIALALVAPGRVPFC